MWLKKLEGTVSPEESLALGLSPGTPVYRFHRIRYADDSPMSAEYATIIASCLPSLSSVDTSIYEALEKAGNRPVRALQRLRALCAHAPVRAVQVLGADGPAGALEHVRDPQGHLQGACHVFGHAWALVRPDAYVAATGESIDASLVHAVARALGTVEETA